MSGRGSWLANSLWQLSSYPTWARFMRAAPRVAAAQQARLLAYLRQNAATDFGQRHSFAKIKSIAEYQRRVPLTTYDDYQEDVARIAKGADRVLTTSPVILLAPSSGSTAPSKLVPYTRQLQAEFQAGIAPWIFDLMQHIPEIKRGAAYWSISPLTEGKAYTPAGIPIGFEEDSAYLGPLGKRVMKRVLAVPPQARDLRSIDHFRYFTLLHLLGREDLRLISIWNPTFLPLLLAPLAGWWPQLLDDLRHGSFRPDLPVDGGFDASIASSLKALPGRAAQLSRLAPTDYARIWPKLGLISCWADGPARPHAAELAQLFPGVRVQGKGLISTEAFVSFPLVDARGSVLAVNSHFFEFLPYDEQAAQVQEEAPRLAHELAAGEKYSVVATTGGGLYRYHLEDVIEVVGHIHQAPLIHFISKLGRISDRFGEKLNEAFIASVLDSLFADFALLPTFGMLAPNDEAGPFRYTLYLELPAHHRRRLDQAKFAQALDLELCQNFHYAYCRRLGQIAAATIFVIVGDAQKAYIGACLDRGMKLGDIKNASLDRDPGWSSVFTQGSA